MFFIWREFRVGWLVKCLGIAGQMISSIVSLLPEGVISFLIFLIQKRLPKAKIETTLKIIPKLCISLGFSTNQPHTWCSLNVKLDFKMTIEKWSIDYPSLCAALYFLPIMLFTVWHLLSQLLASLQDTGICISPQSMQRISLTHHVSLLFSPLSSYCFILSIFIIFT